MEPYKSKTGGLGCILLRVEPPMLPGDGQAVYVGQYVGPAREDATIKIISIPHSSFLRAFDPDPGVRLVRAAKRLIAASEELGASRNAAITLAEITGEVVEAVPDVETPKKRGRPRTKIPALPDPIPKLPKLNEITDGVFQRTPRRAPKPK